MCQINHIVSAFPWRRSVVYHSLGRKSAGSALVGSYDSRDLASYHSRKSRHAAGRGMKPHEPTTLLRKSGGALPGGVRQPLLRKHRPAVCSEKPATLGCPPYAARAFSRYE